MSATFTDCFCGAGGSSDGAEKAGAEAKLALNHWDRAIETHASNFPHADHECNDVAALTTSRIRAYPFTDIFIASPECTNHSPAKGARRRKPQAASLFDDGPAGDAEQDRSRATMWDVWRFADVKMQQGSPYKAIIVENVVDAFRWGPNDDGSLFAAWLNCGKALGYDFEIVWLNSMFAGAVPQSRDRMYVVWWQKGIRPPNLRVEPRSWCPACERLIDGRQTWKKPDRPWGRYGPQYFYTCPDCHGAVLPGVFPAATAIDWSLPAERIGDRARPLAKNTRQRIRRGLEKLATEPFEIRLGRGAPKPLTLPIVDLASDHPASAVMPVAGNTFERTPGNRARDAAARPLDVVHGTLDRAVVVPPMGMVAARDAHTAPAPTQPTTTRPALVIRDNQRGSNGNASNDAATEPSRTVCAGDRFALVMANRANNVPRPAEQSTTPPILTGESVAVVMRNNRDTAGEMSTPVDQPIRTLTAGCHQSLVVPYHRTSEATAAGLEPTPTLTTRDRCALLVPYKSGNESVDVATAPANTMTTRDSAAVVLTEDEIDDCRFRMFQLHEIAAAMAFHPEYLVKGNKRERMAQYGNAVTPPAMEFLVSRVLEVLG